MGTLFTELLLRYLDGRRWELLTPFVFEFVRGYPIVVPKGFITDFASVPRALWPLLPPTGKYGKAAVVHDFLYRRRLVSRAVADVVFLEAMRQLGVSWPRRVAMYLGVRVFGWGARR